MHWRTATSRHHPCWRSSSVGCVCSMYELHTCTTLSSQRDVISAHACTFMAAAAAQYHANVPCSVLTHAHREDLNNNLINSAHAPFRMRTFGAYFCHEHIRRTSNYDMHTRGGISIKIPQTRSSSSYGCTRIVRTCTHAYADAEYYIC